MPLLTTLTLAAAASAAAPLPATTACTPTRAAQMRFTGSAAEGLARHVDLAPALRAALAARIAQARVDDVVTLGRDGVRGQFRYDDEIRHALIADDLLCDRLDLSAWPVRQAARALVYCEGETCVARSVDGGLLARLKRRAPDSLDALAQALRTRPGGAQTGELLPPPPAMGSGMGWARGRVIVQTRAGLGDRDLDKLLLPHGGKARRLGRSPLHVVELPASASETAVAQLLARHPQLKSAELDLRVMPAMAPNDPYVGSQWHLARIGAPAAWDSARGEGVRIAILDTGVDAAHPDLAGRLVPGWNVVDNNADTADVHGHGTAVAGAAAATLDNGLGVAGPAGAALLMPVRIADANAYAYWSTVAQGLVWAADQGARVANVSYGGVAGSVSVQAAADYLRARGGLVIVAAGNNGIDEGLARTASMVPVAATDESDGRAAWSSYGGFVALAAPGQTIWTTTRGGGYAAWWGTSMASPVVAGVTALVMSAKPALSNAQVEPLLYGTAVDLGAPGRDASFGWGRVDAAAAVRAALATVAPDTQAPTAAIVAPLPGATIGGRVTVDVNAADNLGVSRVELRVNGATVTTDATSPYGFSWDSTVVANGPVSFTAVAIDAAGNAGASGAVTLTVANAQAPDTQPPQVAIAQPVDGAKLAGNQLTVTAQASDNAGLAGLRLQLTIDGRPVASVSGGALSYGWNLNKVAAGAHTLQVVARDAAGNTAAATAQVTR